MSIYVDASFLVSAYSVDANSGSAARIMSVAREVMWVTTFAELEFVNALGLRVFRGQISLSQAKSSRSAFDQDMHGGILQPKSLPDSAFLRASQISRQTTARLGTRTSDLLHIAAALELGADALYTFDRQQVKLAETVKLKTNPLA